MIKKYKNIIIILLYLILTFIPLYNILNVYQWHVKQPEFWQGGLMLIILGAFMLYVKDMVFSYTIAIPIYLYFHGVLLPVVFIFIYFCFFVYIGFSVHNKCNSDYRISIYFFYGLSLWGTGAIILSLLNLGTVLYLDIYSIILLMYVVVRYRMKIDIKTFFISIRKWQNDILSERIPLIIIILAGVALFAKTNVAHDYDSLWYGLRTQYVLIGENSIYDDLGYMAFVYYYPKMVELFYAPISFIEDYSFIISGNIIIYLMILFNGYIFLKKRQLTIRSNLYIIAMLASIPALANIGATAKPDIWGAFLCITSLCIWIDYLKEKNNQYLILSILFIILSFTTKPTYWLWGGECLLYYLIYLIVSKKNEICILVKECLLNKKIIFLTLFFSIGIIYRTVHLTGDPFYPLLTNVFSVDNIYLKTNSTQIFNSNSFTLELILNRIYQFVFDPSKLEHVIMLWTANVYIILGIVYIFDPYKKFKYNEVIILLIMITTMLYYMISLPVPDGNYFIFPIVICVLFISSLCSKSHIDKCCDKKILLIVVAMFSIMLVSHSSWSYGTTSFPKKIIVNNYETKERNYSICEYWGIGKIYNAVADFNHNDRVISSLGKDNFTFRIPCALEHFGEINSIALSNTYWSSSYEVFCRYLEKINVKAIILLESDESKLKEYTNLYIKDHIPIRIIVDKKGICYIFR